MSKKHGTRVLKENCFFHKVKQVLAESPKAIMEKKSFELLNKFNDKSGRLLISNMLEKIDNINHKNIVFGGDFNLFFEAKLETQGGNPVLKKIFSESNTNKKKN